MLQQRSANSQAISATRWLTLHSDTNKLLCRKWSAIFSTVCKYKFVIWSHMVELQNEYKIGAVYI